MQNLEKAFYLFKDSAEQGNPTGQNCLGVCYYQGLFIKKDYEQAVKWYKRAAKLGNSNAMFNLSECYFYGHGVEPSFEESSYWREKSNEKRQEEVKGSIFGKSDI